MLSFFCNFHNGGNLFFFSKWRPLKQRHCFFEQYFKQMPFYLSKTTLEVLVSIFEVNNFCFVSKRGRPRANLALGLNLKLSTLSTFGDGLLDQEQ